MVEEADDDVVGEDEVVVAVVVIIGDDVVGNDEVVVPAILGDDDVISFFDVVSDSVFVFIGVDVFPFDKKIVSNIDDVTMSLFEDTSREISFFRGILSTFLK